MHMKIDELQEEERLLLALEERKMNAFMRLYKSYGEDLLIFAYTYLQDPALAIETVDELIFSRTNTRNMRTKIYLLIYKRFQTTCLLLILGLFCGTGAFAQAYVGQIEYRNARQPAATIRLPYNAGSVEDGLKEYMTAKGFKKSTTSGLIVFRGVPLDNSDTAGSDLYFSTDPAGRKEKDMTLLNLLAVQKNQDLLVRTQGDSDRIDKARLFLDSLAIFMDVYNTRLQLNSRQEGLNKAQQKMNALINDSTDLDKKLRRLQSDLAGNQADQVKAAAELQTNINADEDTKKKSQKKLNRLIDDQGSLEKKIRKTQADMEENKTSRKEQQDEIDKDQQGLAAVKARQAAE